MSGGQDSVEDESVDAIGRQMADRMRLTDSERGQEEEGQMQSGGGGGGEGGGGGARCQKEEEEGERAAEETANDEGESTETDQPISKGKPHSSRGPTVSQDVRKRLQEVVNQRRPVEFTIDPVTLDTPVHKLLDQAVKTGCLAENLQQKLNHLLHELQGVGLLEAFINVYNKSGRTPLSLSLKFPILCPAIVPLVESGAQAHHLCGALRERCNHLHYAMVKSAPEAINALLDVLHSKNQLDSMYAINQRGLTPKEELRRRISEQWSSRPLESDRLSQILDRIRGIPPVDLDPAGLNFAN